MDIFRILGWEFGITSKIIIGWVCNLWTDSMEIMEVEESNFYDLHESTELIREFKML